MKQMNVVKVRNTNSRECGDNGERETLSHSFHSGYHLLNVRCDAVRKEEK